MYIVTKVLIGVSPYVSRSSKVGECCRWRLSSMSIDIFDILFSASFARRTQISVTVSDFAVAGLAEAVDVWSNSRSRLRYF